jgi:Tol biopolymer transport system component
MRLGVAFDTAWSPDGDQIAYSLYDVSQETFQVWLHDTATGEQTQILPAGTTVVDWLEPTSELMQRLRQYSVNQ